MESSFSYDALTRVLSYLPAKSIAKLKTTNKHFTSNYISDEFFFLSQSNHLQTDSGFLIATPTSSEIFFLDPHSGIPQESLELLQRTPNILASSNGLIFSKTMNDVEPQRRFYVYNLVHKTRCLLPSTLDKKYFFDPFIGIAVVYYGDMLAYYKLVCVMQNDEWDHLGYWDNQAFIRVYDSKQNEWIDQKKKIDLGPRSIKFKSPVVLGNNVFWASDNGAYLKCEPYILAFNIDSEKSWFIHLPKKSTVLDIHDEYNLTISKKDDESLNLVKFYKFQRNFIVWVMKIDHGVAKWNIVNEISLSEMGLENKLEREIRSYALMKGGEILVFVTDLRDVYAYNFHYNTLKRIGKTKFDYAPIMPYANTLRPCGINLNVWRHIN